MVRVTMLSSSITFEGRLLCEEREFCAVNKRLAEELISKWNEQNPCRYHYKFLKCEEVSDYGNLDFWWTQFDMSSHLLRSLKKAA